MFYYCTLFDSFYLIKGLTMYRSLEKSCDNFHLYIFAFDDRSYNILNKLKLQKATIISLSEFEDDKLLAVKPTRTKAEYCWTCTSSSILYIIEKYNVPNCTYIDADLFFYQNPNVLFDEMSSKSILLTEHRYPLKFNRVSSSGVYCVQFITFVNDENGTKALRWWRDACIDWCFNRYEDDKFGDQKYLDDWTTRFKGVHVLQHLGGGIAAWNVEQYEFIERKNNRILFFDKTSKSKFEAIFYHFHHVRFFKNDIVDLGWREQSRTIVDNLYVPYFIELDETENIIRQVDRNFDIPLEPFSVINNSGIKGIIKYLIKMIFRYSVYNKRKLISKYKAK
ncbi:MAG: glycosyl transferase [Bacteroidetes bacterium]|nr:glycosyl transferase [Bacteroidota bacterium]